MYNECWTHFNLGVTHPAAISHRNTESSFPDFQSLASYGGGSGRAGYPPIVCLFVIEWSNLTLQMTIDVQFLIIIDSQGWLNYLPIAFARALI